MKIAVLLNSDGNIININNTNLEGAQRQASLDDSIVVESDSDFNVDEAYKWTVRESDNVLVHKDTNQAPEEEKNSVITQLTLQNLSLANDVADLKKLTTAQTLQSLQDSKDKSEQQEVITGLTKEILELKNNITSETK